MLLETIFLDKSKIVKKLFIYIATILLMMPPQMVHNDTIVYDNVEEHLHSETTHDDFHHKNDSEHDKKTKHHHHCTVEIFTLTAYINETISTPEVLMIYKKTDINYSKALHTSAFIGSLFRPPILFS